MEKSKLKESDFRSRTEYLWYLVFLENFNSVLYESVKVNTLDLHYTPDFILNSKRWIEVKDNSLTKMALKKAIELHKLYKMPITILDGFPMRHLDEIREVRVLEIKNGEISEITSYRPLENIMLGIGLTSHGHFDASNKKHYRKFYESVRKSFKEVYFHDKNVFRTDSDIDLGLNEFG